MNTSFTHFSSFSEISLTPPSCSETSIVTVSAVQPVETRFSPQTNRQLLRDSPAGHFVLLRLNPQLLPPPIPPGESESTLYWRCGDVVQSWKQTSNSRRDQHKAQPMRSVERGSPDRDENGCVHWLQEMSGHFRIWKVPSFPGSARVTEKNGNIYKPIQEKRGHTNVNVELNISSYNT